MIIIKIDPTTRLDELRWEPRETDSERMAEIIFLHAGNTSQLFDFLSNDDRC